MRVITVNRSVSESNDRDADRLRARMKEEGVLLINLMSAPGSGKTTFLSRTVTDLKADLRFAAPEGTPALAMLTFAVDKANID